MRALYIAIFVIAFFFNRGVAAADYANYEVKKYEAIVTLTHGSPDVDVRLNITYEVFSGSKSDGFKYLGPYVPSEVSGTDENGRIRVIHTKEREHKISWYFSRVSSGEKSVSIQFKVPNALKGGANSNKISFPWVGIFKVPVRNATYQIIFPHRFKPQILSSSGAYVQSQDNDGRTVVNFNQSPLVERKLAVKFSPVIIELSWNFGSLISQFFDMFSEGTWVDIIFFGFFALALGSGFINRRNKSVASGGSCGFSGCSGGGSCGGGGGCGGGCGG